MAERTRFELAHVLPPTPLAGEPLKPLGYLSVFWEGGGELTPRPLLFTSQSPISSSPSYVILAGAVGIEPTTEVLETSVLPLNYTPIWWAGMDSNHRTFRGGFTVHCV